MGIAVGIYPPGYSSSESQSSDLYPYIYSRPHASRWGLPAFRLGLASATAHAWTHCCGNGPRNQPGLFGHIAAPVSLTHPERAKVHVAAPQAFALKSCFAGTGMYMYVHAHACETVRMLILQQSIDSSTCHVPWQRRRTGTGTIRIGTCTCMADEFLV